MADNPSRLSVPDVRAAVKRVQTEGERLVGRVRRDTEALVARSRRQVVSELLRTTRRVQADVRDRAERVLHELERRRAQISATLENQAGGLVETVSRRLNFASGAGVKDLQKRLAGLEQRVGRLARVRNVPTLEEVADLRKRMAELERRLDAFVRRGETRARNRRRSGPWLSWWSANNAESRVEPRGVEPPTSRVRSRPRAATATESRRNVQGSPEVPATVFGWCRPPFGSRSHIQPT